MLLQNYKAALSDRQLAEKANKALLELFADSSRKLDDDLTDEEVSAIYAAYDALEKLEIIYFDRARKHGIKLFKEQKTKKQTESSTF